MRRDAAAGYGAPSMARLLPAVLVLVATSALAHIHLDAPPSFQVTDALGNPQKTAPCGGAGTASNVVTTVEAGSTLTVTWTDTIPHPGHYRISVAPNQGDFVTPVPVLNNGGTNCQSAPIEANPVLPTVADGVFPHTTGATGMVRSYDITVPMMSCDNCTLQLMQFMASHAPPCFYYQCATLRIVPPDAGTPMDAGTDAGAGDDAGTDAGTDTDAGTTTDAGTSTDAGSGSDAGTMTDGGMDPGTAGGCGCSTPVDVSALGLALVLLARVARRRR